MPKSFTKPKIIRACTVSQSVSFVKGMIPDLVKDYELVLLASPGPYWDELGDLKNKIKCIEVTMARQILIKQDLKSLWNLWRVFRKEKPTMVHSITPKAGLLCMMAAKLARVPFRVHTFTGLVFPTSTGLKRRILMFTDWLTCACATHIIPEGEGVRHDLLSHKITKKNIKVLGYGNIQGIDLKYFDPKINYDFTKKYNKTLGTTYLLNDDFWKDGNKNDIKPYLSPECVSFICIGRLVGDKGINELVKAFIRLLEEHKNVRLILLGHANLSEDPISESTLKIIETTAEIESVGFHYDVRPWLASADVAILASYREGFPNVVIEAGAMGLPQIVTDINGANEIIIEGKNGTIIPPRDVDALYHAMKRMLNSDYRESLAKNARQMISSRYDQHYVRQCLYDFYKEIIPNQL